MNVLIPEAALLKIGLGKFPLFCRVVKPLEQTLFLLVFRNVQKKLQDNDVIVHKIALEELDVAKARLPEAVRLLVGLLLKLAEQLRVNAGYDDVLVVRPVEDCHAAALGHDIVCAPKVIVAPLFGGWLLKTTHNDTGRVEAGHHVFDDAILARGIHALEYDEHSVPCFCIQLILQLRQDADIRLEFLLGILARSEVSGIVRIVRFKPHFARWVNQVAIGTHLAQVRRLFENHCSWPPAGAARAATVESSSGGRMYGGFRYGRSLRVMRAVLLFVVLLAGAHAYAISAQMPLRPPQIDASQAGAVIDDVSIQTYGVINADAVRQYLSLKKGDVLTQDGIDRDYNNILRLVAFIPRLEIAKGASPKSVRLYWIVMAKWLQATSHSFYTNQPLVAPLQGALGPGFVLTSAQITKRGANFSAIGQIGPPTYLARVLYTNPQHINAMKGRQSDLVADIFGGRALYRASQPVVADVYSWNTGVEALYWIHGTKGTQLLAGGRVQRSTSALSTGIVAPSLFPTSLHPAQNTLLEILYSHGCPVAPTQWYPPFCSTQYRFAVLDTIGLLENTSMYQVYLADVSQYIRLRSSTVALHVSVQRTGGVLPDSSLVCGSVRAYPRPFCGTDAQTLQAEFRLADRIATPLHFVVFTETSASRVRGGSQAFASSGFQWHPDSGVGVIYRGVRINVAKGTEGWRITFELQGQAY